jgi:enamine deaminase RidA (YjgF/YER057c/UK114 family)
MANYLPEKTQNRPHAEAQTDNLILRLLADLRPQRASLAEDVLRTWYYIRDIDNNYHDMVTSRRRHYEAHGLLPETHFIASTGIEATAPEPSVLSWMTTLTTLGLLPAQISYLKALKNLSPTHVYGVNFERATKVDFGDRAHIHISGTASIDSQGQVVHVGDIARQCGRTAENIAALLEEGGMKLSDMRYAIVYLRDSAEAAHVEPALSEIFGDTPRLTVRGAVCRPDWLIEMEGLAAVSFPVPDKGGFKPYL